MSLDGAERTLLARSLIGGRPGGSDGHRLDVADPSTGAVAGALVEADAHEVDAAVAAARAAFDRTDWPRWPVARRQALLRAVSEAILAHAEELARLECLALGVPLRELRARHVPPRARDQLFAFFAEHIGQASGEVYDQTEGYRTIVVREPVGVAALIAPWNAPVALASMKLAAALAFGNATVLKPSEQTPFALARLVEILHEAGVPEGVVNLVNGRGPVTGTALVAHPGVDLVSFTGGTEDGAGHHGRGRAPARPLHDGARRQERQRRLRLGRPRARTRRGAGLDLLQQRSAMPRGLAHPRRTAHRGGVRRRLRGPRPPHPRGRPPGRDHRDGSAGLRRAPRPGAALREGCARGTG